MCPCVTHYGIEHGSDFLGKRKHNLFDVPRPQLRSRLAITAPRAPVTVMALIDLAAKHLSHPAPIFDQLDDRTCVQRGREGCRAPVVAVGRREVSRHRDLWMIIPRCQ